MSQNDFGGAVIPAMAGLLFWKKAKVQEIRQEPIQQLPAVIAVNSNTLTGVARYLSTLPSVTGVSKYLKHIEKNQISGVEKYLLRQSIGEKNAPRPTTVSKYLATVANSPSGKQKTTVDKYLLNLEFLAKQQVGLTGVARYQAEQSIFEKRKKAAELIERYIKAEKEAALAAAELKRVAYEQRLQEEIDTPETPAATGLGRYIQKHAKSDAKTTGVARYIAKQIIAESQKPQLSSVAKYLRNQNLHTASKPTVTGVAKYLAQLDKLPAKPKKVKLPPSRVDRYLDELEKSERLKPKLSGVAKYLEKVSKFKQDQPVLSLPSQGAVDGLDQQKCLEGEFIPAANETTEPRKLTGVSRYVKQQEAQVSNADISNMTPSEKAEITVTGGASTGVSRYLESHSVKANPANSIVSNRKTGVDRYLQSRA
jgi:hypothetical protein